MPLHHSRFLPLLLLLLSTPTKSQPARKACITQPTLLCTLQPTTGSKATGLIIFRPLYRPSNPGHRGPCVVQISAKLTKLRPGLHGIHIHTYGDTTRSDGSSAGGHFSNPKGNSIPHGLPDDRQRHWGDLGSVRARVNGNARYFRVDRTISIAGIVGRGVVVHAGPDLGSAAQPSGGSGARIGSCVIGIANPDSL